MKPSAERIEAGLIVAAGAIATGAAIYEGAKFANQLIHGQDKDQQKEIPVYDILDESQNSGDGSLLLTKGEKTIVEPHPEPAIPYILL